MLDEEPRPRFKPPGKPSRLLTLLFKAPAYAYHLKMGWLLGNRFLLLTHAGTKTGRIRHTVLEVIHHDPRNEESLVVSAYGKRAGWYRDITSRSALEVRTGRRRYVPEQRFLTEKEVHDTFVEFERAHPKYVRRLLKLLGVKYDDSDDSKRALTSFLRMVAFRPRRSE